MIRTKISHLILHSAGAAALALLCFSHTATATTLTNGGFETGTGVTNPNNANPWVWSPSTNGERVNALTNSGADNGDGTNGTHLIDPLYGSWFGYVENSASNGTASVYQTVEVDAQSPILSFDWRFFTSEESLSGHNDIFEVAAYPGVGDTITSTVATVDATAMTTSNGPLYSPVGGPPGLDQGFTRYTVAWAHKSLDLSALIGQTVTVYFRVSDAGDGHSESTGFAVDNIQFVPEPSAFVLAGFGGVALLALRRARSRR